MAGEVISKADKARITRLDNIDSAFVMLFLVNQFHTEQLAAFPRELILGICWEESFFQNIPQLGGPAVGYGQLERDGRRIANQHATNNLSDFTEGSFTAAAILASREKSISAHGDGIPQRPGKVLRICWARNSLARCRSPANQSISIGIAER